MADPFVVVGGDAAGMSAASKAKRENPDIDVVVFEKGQWVSYAACGMPYFIKGEIEEIDDLVQVTPREFREERDVDLRTGHEVVGIDPDAKTVTVAADGDRFEQAYEDLLIATGASAIEPPFPGLDLDGVFTIHNMDEAGAIERYVSEEEPETAAIVGGGYVGIEMAEALDARGLDVQLFEMLPHVLQPFGEVVAGEVEAHLQDQGVELHLDTAVQGFAGEGSVAAVDLEDEESVPADIVIVGVGVSPNAESVFAAGDCAEATNVVTGEPDHVPLALTANRAGRAIGQTVTGNPTQTGEMAGTAIVKAFDLGAARTGLVDEEAAAEAGFDPVSVEIQAPSRAHYYPGPTPLTVTLVADRETERVLGGSIVGREGVKRIDTIATALHAGLTVTELENLDLAYAPPFSPVWDPVLTAGRVLQGKLG